jgi:hypothetical protein
MSEGLKEFLYFWHATPQTNIFRNGPLAKSGLPSGDWYCAFTPRIPLEQVKVARRAFKTSFYCIVFAAVVGD